MIGVASPDLSLVRPGARGDQPVLPRQLVCLPHAGGNATAFAPWRGPLAERGWSLFAPALPGRLGRLDAAAPASLGHLAEDLATVVAHDPRLSDPVLLGHSFGAVVAFETARRLVARGRPAPRVVVSGALPPHLRPGDDRTDAWDDDRLLEHIYGLEGTPAQLRGEVELEQLLLRAFRLDIGLLEDHELGPDLPCGLRLLVLTGSADAGAPLATMRRWQDLVEPPIRLRVLPGGHFFPWQASRFLDTVLDELARP